MDETQEFYKIKPKMECVDYDTFKQFINAYPRHLTTDCYGACEPPLITYNDFELAERWPYSIVASTYFYSDDPDNYYYEPPEKRLYRIMVNFREVYNSRIKRSKI